MRPPSNPQGRKLRRQLVLTTKAHKGGAARLLRHYLYERFLARLSDAPLGHDCLLAGRALFHALQAPAYPHFTGLDLLYQKSVSQPELASALRALLSSPQKPSQSDVSFFADTLETLDPAADLGLEGLPFRFHAALPTGQRAELSLTLWLGEGAVPAGALTPSALQSLLPDDAQPRIRLCPPALIVAHKVLRLIDAGIQFKPRRDLYELNFLAQTGSLTGAALTGTISEALRRRAVFVPDTLLPALSYEFAASPLAAATWASFCRAHLGRPPEQAFGAEVAAARRFLAEPMEALAQHRPFNKQWLPGGPWR